MSTCARSWRLRTRPSLLDLTTRPAAASRFGGTMRFKLAIFLAGLGLAVPAFGQEPTEPINPPPHYAPWPDLGTGLNERQNQASLILGPELQRGQPAREMLAERRRL